MKINYIWLVLILFTNSLATAASSFVEKNYLHIRQQGKVQVTCRAPYADEYASFWCEGSYLSPATSAHFTTSKRSDLHHVTLTIQNADGSHTKEWRLNSSNGKTWFSIPLWGANGILTEGPNKIHYSVEAKNSQVIETGDFETTVSQAPVRECRPLWLNSSNSMDCQAPGYACSQLNFPRTECQ